MHSLYQTKSREKRFYFCLQATNEVVYRVPKATQEEMTAAVNSCSRAFHSWSETSILARQQIFLRYQQMIKDNIVSQRIRKYKVQMKLEYWTIWPWFLQNQSFDRSLKPVAEFDIGVLPNIENKKNAATKHWHKLTRSSTHVSERTRQVHYSGTGKDPCRCRGGRVQRIA